LEHCSVNLFSVNSLIPGLNSDFPSGNAGPQQAGAVLSEIFHFSNGSRQAVAELAHWIASVHTPGLRTCRPPLGILTAVVWNNGIIVSMGRRRQTTGCNIVNIEISQLQGTWPRSSCSIIEQSPPPLPKIHFRLTIPNFVTC
jgi:hypothetical protein